MKLHRDLHDHHAIHELCSFNLDLHVGMFDSYQHLGKFDSPTLCSRDPWLSRMNALHVEKHVPYLDIQQFLHISLPGHST